MSPWRATTVSFLPRSICHVEHQTLCGHRIHNNLMVAAPLYQQGYWPSNTSRKWQGWNLNVKWLIPKPMLFSIIYYIQKEALKIFFHSIDGRKVIEGPCIWNWTSCVLVSVLPPRSVTWASHRTFLGLSVSSIQWSNHAPCRIIVRVKGQVRVDEHTVQTFISGSRKGFIDMIILVLRVAIRVSEIKCCI